MYTMTCMYVLFKTIFTQYCIIPNFRLVLRKRIHYSHRDLLALTEL